MTAAEMDAQRDRIIKEIQAEWSPETEYSRRVQKCGPVEILESRRCSLSRSVAAKAPAKMHDESPMK